MREDRYVEIDFDEIIRETDKAFLLSIDEDEKVWLPKSQCEIIESGIVEVAEWIAIDKGLV